MEKTNEIMTLAQNFTILGVPGWALLAMLALIIVAAIVANEITTRRFREMPNRAFRRWKQDL